MPQGDRVIASHTSPARGLGNNAKIEIEHPTTGQVTISFMSNLGFRQTVILPRSWVKMTSAPNGVQLTFAGQVLASQGGQGQGQPSPLT